MERKVITKALLQKYLEGRCTEEEARQVEDWYDSLDYSDGHQTTGFFDKEEVYAKVHAAINTKLEHKESNRSGGIRRRIYWMTSIAAAVLLVVVSAKLFTTKDTPPNESLAKKENATYNETTSFTNTSSGIERKMLPDGSSVWLSPGASVNYYRKHKDSAREVNFSGEGFFDVAKDKLHPFIIYSGEMQTRVVGTSFSVQAFPDSRTFKVSVVTGKVQVSVKSKTPIFLEPGQQANYVVATKGLSKEVIPDEKLRTEYWKPLTLSFDEAAFSDIAIALEKAFDVKVQLSNAAINNCHLKVDFNNQKLPQVMEWLEKLMDVKCSLDGDVFTISGEGCGQ